MRNLIMNIRNAYLAAKGRLVFKAGTLQANDLHHYYVMQSQDDVPFPWHDRTMLNARISVCNFICGPINQ